MELLIVIGILSILFAITIRAINPLKQLTDARNAKRHASVVTLESAVKQYIVDGHSFTNIPTSKAAAKDICQHEVPAATCTGPLVDGYDLSDLVPTYIVGIPVDDDEVTETFSGYRIYQEGSLIRVCAPRMDGECGS